MSLSALAGRTIVPLYSVSEPADNDGSLFGVSCVLSGDGTTLVIGDPSSSRVFVYQHDTTGRWELWKTVSPSGSIASVQNFGRSLAVHSNGLRVLVGFPNDTGDTGVALYQFASSVGTFTLRTTATDSEISNFGAVVAAMADTSIVAVASGESSGGVRLFSATAYSDNEADGVSLTEIAFVSGVTSRSLALAGDSDVSGKFVLAVGTSDDVLTYGLTSSGIITDGSSFSSSGTSVSGALDTGLGYSVAMSEDGLMLVAGKYSGVTSEVQTYQREVSEYTWTSVAGATLSGTNLGLAVALSPEGDLLLSSSGDELTFYKKNLASFTEWAQLEAVTGSDVATSVSVARPRNNLAVMVATSASSGSFTLYDLTAVIPADWTAMKAVPRVVVSCDEDTINEYYRYGRFQKFWRGILDSGMSGWAKFPAYFLEDGYASAVDEVLTPHNILGFREDLVEGQRACAVSHVRLWTWLSAQASGTVMEDATCAWILEDDALPCEDFDGKASTVFGSTGDDWDMIYMGHGGIDSVTEVSSTASGDDPIVVSTLPVACLHAYVLTDVGARRLLNWLRAYNRFASGSGIPKIDDVVTMLQAINVFVANQGAIANSTDDLARLRAWRFIRSRAVEQGLTAVPNSGGTTVNLATDRHSEVLDACRILAREYPFKAYVWHKDMSSADRTSLYGNADYADFSPSFGSNESTGSLPANRDGFSRDRGLVYQDDLVAPVRGKGVIYGGFRLSAPEPFSVYGGPTPQTFSGDPYRYVVFTEGTTEVSLFGTATVDVLIVGGGGGSGYGKGTGGGGGGAVVLLEDVEIGNQLVTIEVGAGGAGGTSSTPSTNGGNSKFGDYVALGGGNGGGDNHSLGSNGGCGGGHRHNRFNSGSTTEYGRSIQFSTYGYGVGNDAGSNTTSTRGSGGGGAGILLGAGSGGTGGRGYAFLNNPGIQVDKFVHWGTTVPGILAVYFGAGGTGGGTSGATSVTAGQPNTGQGASGVTGSGVRDGASGGSGIVIIRYLPSS